MWTSTLDKCDDMSITEVWCCLWFTGKWIPQESGLGCNSILDVCERSETCRLMACPHKFCTSPETLALIFPQPLSANTWRWPSVVSMLGQRRRRWPSIETTLGKGPVFVWLPLPPSSQFPSLPTFFWSGWRSAKCVLNYLQIRLPIKLPIWICRILRMLHRDWCTHVHIYHNTVPYLFLCGFIKHLIIFRRVDKSHQQTMEAERII